MKLPASSRLVSIKAFPFAQYSTDFTAKCYLEELYAGYRLRFANQLDFLKRYSKMQIFVEEGIMSGVTPEQPLRAVGLEREEASKKISIVATDGRRLPFTPEQKGYIDLTVPARPETFKTKGVNGETYEYVTEAAPKNIRLQVNSEQIILTNTPRDLPPAQEITKELEKALKRERLLCITTFTQSDSEAGVSSVDLQRVLHGRKQSQR